MTKAKLLQSNLDRAFPTYAPHKVHETFSPEVGFMRVAEGSWRFVDLDETTQICAIGQNYRIRADLMNDMSRFLRDRGYDVKPTDEEAASAINALPLVSVRQGFERRTGHAMPNPVKGAE